MTTVILPAGSSAPRFLQGAYALIARPRGMRRMRDRYGDTFTVHVPVYGRVVVISDPTEIKQLFTTGPEVVDKLPNLGRVTGPGSLFATTGAEHLAQRKLLVPPLHGRRLAPYETIVEEETVRELASWPQGRAFATLPSMRRITLNAILRVVFGVEGAEFVELRDLLPRMLKLGVWLVAVPIPEVDWGRWSPWGRLWAMRRDYYAIITRLIAKALRDKGLDERTDVLALMLRSRYDDGSSMNDGEIADQLLTLLGGGYETMSTTLAWAIERLRRHPDVLRSLVEEVDAGGTALREATILEVLRTRPAFDLIGRRVKVDGFRLGRWTLPKGCVVLVSITLVHEDESVFPNARGFDPFRFVDARPNMWRWIPFGAGGRRCIGAAFAHMEMNVVLRTLLRLHAGADRRAR